MPPGARDPVRAEPGGHEEAAHVRLAEDELVVRGEGLGAVDHPVDAGVRDGRDAADGAGHDLLEARPVRRQELAVEVGRHAVERPRRRVPLVAAHAQPADLLAEVAEVVGIAQGRQSGAHALDALGEDVLVRHGDDGHGHARQPADLRREHAAGVDDHVRVDRRALAAMLDLDPGHAPALDADPHHPCLRPDGRSAGTGAGRHGQGKPRRVEPAVGRQEDGAEHAVGRHQREGTPRLVRPDQLQRQPERPCPGRLPAQLLHALGRARQAQRADLVPAGIDAGLVQQAPVELRAVHHHPGQARGAAQLPDQSRPSGRSSRWSAPRARAGPRPSSRAASGGRRCWCRRPRRR